MNTPVKITLIVVAAFAGLTTVAMIVGPDEKPAASVVTSSVTETFTQEAVPVTVTEVDTAAAEAAAAEAAAASSSIQDRVESLIESAPETAQFPDGDFFVGAQVGEMPPGTYRSSVPGDSFGCYWEARRRVPKGPAGNIIENDLADAGTVVIVNVLKGWYVFHTSGCGVWEAAGK